MTRFFEHDDFQFMLELALGAAYHRGADIGECLAVAGRIRDGDAESWFREWSGLGDRISEQGRASEDRDHRVSARESYLRAATYYDTATFFLDSTTDADRFLPTWNLHREAWDRAASLFDTPAERVRIPYEGAELEGYLFRVDDSGAQRPLVIMNNGSDGPVSAMWLQGGAGALARGYNWLAFDGPGQGAALWQGGLGFRPDWEAVITPVVDFVRERPEVDEARIALIGVSQAGYWVPRAVAFERRIAAAVADPGVWDILTSWLAHLPPPVRKQLDDDERDEFNRSLGWVEGSSPAASGTLAFRMRPFKLETPYDVYAALRDYNLEGVAERIECPILITDPEGEQFWLGQARKLYDAVASPEKRLVTFTAAEGADSHCEPKALGQRDRQIFDWLDETLAP